MGVITRQLLDTYYATYRDKEIMFSREITKTLYLMPRQVYIKCGGEQWPCIINSTSFLFVRIIVGTLGGAFKKLTESKSENESVSIRFCFAQPENDVVSFFVNAHVSEISRFNGKQDLALFTLTFSQRPPNALIERVGQIHEANKNAHRRAEERIILNNAVIRKLQLELSKTKFFIEKVPRKNILRDISFSGAKLIVVGIAKYLKNKSAVLFLSFEDPEEEIQLQGTVINLQEIENRPELAAISIKFDNPSLLYKMRISNYLSSFHRRSIGEDAENSNLEDKNKDPKTVKKTELPVVNPLDPSDIKESTLDTEDNKE